MGFYLKKGFNIGPVRVNLSKSGLGISLGGKGLRLGSGPKGAYVHAGKGGLYYRKNLSGVWKWIIPVIAVIVLAAWWAVSSGAITINL